MRTVRRQTLELRHRIVRAGGFSLVDVLVTVSLIGIVAAVTIPAMHNTVDEMQLGEAARQVEREMQVARQRAVGRSRVVRIRFNCPDPGAFRMVELIGTAAAPAEADAATNRCSESSYPFPAGDDDQLTRPNLDGPVRRLPDSVAFQTAETIEFWPNGTAHHDTGVNPWPVIPVAGIHVTLGRYGKTSSISVNGLGRIQLHAQPPDQTGQ